MSRPVRMLLACSLLLGHAASAESLRCNGYSLGEGDTRLAVLFQCGQPLLVDSHCAPVFSTQTQLFVPEPFASSLLPCQVVEEWVYDRGPGNLLATVRFRGGIVQSIRYGRVPQ